MGDANGVGLGQRAGDLRAETGDIGGGQRAAPKPRPERLAFDQFHDQERRADIVERADVRMVERGQRQRFAAKAQTECGSRHFDRDWPVESGVQPAKHLAHAAAAQQLVDTIVSEQAPDLQERPILVAGAGRDIAPRGVSQQRFEFGS